MLIVTALLSCSDSEEKTTNSQPAGPSPVFSYEAREDTACMEYTSAGGGWKHVTRLKDLAGDTLMDAVWSERWDQTGAWGCEYNTDPAVTKQKGCPPIWFRDYDPGTSGCTGIMRYAGSVLVNKNYTIFLVARTGQPTECAKSFLSSGYGLNVLFCGYGGLCTNCIHVDHHSNMDVSVRVPIGQYTDIPALYTVRYTQADSVVLIYRNGVELGNGKMEPLSQNEQASLGNTYHYADDGETHGLGLYEVHVYNTALDASTRSKIEQALMVKWKL